jgi:hypothetical protein
MVVEVSCVEMAPDGLLRHVSYLGKREYIGRNVVPKPDCAHAALSWIAP